MNIFRFILFVIALCFSIAYWWYCWENGITNFVGYFLDEDSFFAKFLSLLIIAASIGLVIWAFCAWFGPAILDSWLAADAQTVIQEAEQADVFIEGETL